MPTKPDVNQVLAEIEKLERFIDDSEFWPASRFYRSNVLLALISKALTVSRAVCALVQAHFAGEAFGLSRKQEFDYEVIYWWTSQFVHGTILSLAGHEMEPGGVFRIRGRMEAESGRGSEALFNVLIYLSKIIICAFRGMKADQPEELLTEIRELVTSFTL